MQNGFSEKLQTRSPSQIQLISLHIHGFSFSGMSDAMAMQGTT
jgi:hypothetical protein